MDLSVSPAGDLYYLARGTGSLWRVYSTSSQAPTIGAHPAGVTVAVGQAATFTVSASGTAPLAYQWQRNGVDIGGATSASYTLPSALLSDSGAQFRCVVRNAFGSATSNPATLTVQGNGAPTGVITAPTSSTLYAGGDVVSYSGSATDPEDGALPASAFTWQVDFHHDVHTHPFLPPTTGSKTGSVTIPTVGETSANVWYRFHLTVRDSAGATHSSFVDVRPRTVTLTLATSPTGLQLLLDGQPVIAPVSVTGVVGILRSLEAVSPQNPGGVHRTFASWSDGGARAHAVSTPGVSTTYTATFAAMPAVNVDDREVASGAASNAAFRVWLTAPSSQTITVNYATAAGTAVAGTDYGQRSGTLTFTPGRRFHTIVVPILNDAAGSTRTFTVNLSAPANATVGDGQALGTTGRGPPTTSCRCTGPTTPPPTTTSSRPRSARRRTRWRTATGTSRTRCRSGSRTPRARAARPSSGCTTPPTAATTTPRARASATP